MPKGVELTGRNLGCALHELHASIELDEGSVCAAPVPFFHVAGLGMLLRAAPAGGPQGDPRRPGADGAAAAAGPARSQDRRLERAQLCRQSYGLTESTGGFTLLGPGDHAPAEEFAHRLRSAGRPMRGARVRVVDPVTLADCPASRRGEVLVAGSRIMKGYWRKPGPTAEVMLLGGWLRTGDGGSFDADGYLYLHDRLTDMIVTGGENVYPAEVESVVTGHPAGVSFAAFLARTASGKLQKKAIRASLSPVAVQ